jgi:hypothetical protein
MLSRTWPKPTNLNFPEVVVAENKPDDRFVVV